MAGGNVSPQLAQIFNQAGRANGIPPAVLAGIMSVESSMGQNQGPSSAGAVGPMQFLPATAQSLGINPHDTTQAVNGAAKLLNQYGYKQNPGRAIGAYNGGPGNPQMGYARQVLSEAQRLSGQLAKGGVQGGALPQLGGSFSSGGGATGYSVPFTTQSFDSAGYQQAKDKYIAGSFLSASKANSSLLQGSGGISTGSNPLFAKGLLTTKAPNPQNFLTTATHSLQELVGQPLVNVHPNAAGYVNPIPGAVIGRTDMGVDASLKPGAPIRAIGNSTLKQVIPNWYAGQPLLLFQLNNGPQAGKFWYVSEQINPKTTQVGTQFGVGQPVASFAPSGTGIEIGWGSPSSNSRTLAGQQGNTGGAGHSNSPAGQNFRAFLSQLGAK